MLVVFVHVLLHPWVHAMGTVKPASDHLSVSDTSTALQSDLSSADRCELCRVGHNARVSPKLPKTDLLNPRWVHITLQAVNYASLQADRRLPSRAPPVL